MKFADLVRQATTATSTVTVTLGAAVAGFRALADAITQGASDPNAVKVSDTVCFCVSDAAGNKEVALYTVTAPDLLTRQTILASSNAGAAVAFPAGTKDAFCTVPGAFFASVLTSADGLTIGQLAAASSIPDTYALELFDPATGTSLKATVAALKAVFGGTGGSSTTPADTTPPTFASAQVSNATPTVIQITMSESLNAAFTPAASAFAVSGGKTVSSVSVSGAVVSLTCNSAYVNGNAITVTYTKPSSGNTLQDVAGNATASFGPSTVTNNIAAAGDTVAPTASSAAVANSTPAVVVLTMSEPMDAAYAPAASAFTVGGHTVSSVAVSGSTISLTVSAAFANGEAARTVAYTQPGTGNARDLAGNLLANFSGLAITNNVAAAATGYTFTNFYNGVAAGTSASPINVSAKPVYNSAHVVAMSDVWASNLYWNAKNGSVSSTAASSGWSNSPTVPPSGAMAQGVNGWTAMGGSTSPFQDNSQLWVANGSGASVWYEYMKGDDGVAVCVTPNGVYVTGA